MMSTSNQPLKKNAVGQRKDYFLMKLKITTTPSPEVNFKMDIVLKWIFLPLTGTISLPLKDRVSNL